MNNLHRLHQRPKPIPVYRPHEGERLQDGEQSKIDYEVRVRLEGLADPDTPQPGAAPGWLPALLMFMMGFAAGVFVCTSVLSP